MKTTSSRKDTLRGVLGYVGRYRGYLVASLALCVITVASTLYVPILTGNAVDLLLGPARWILRRCGPFWPASWRW